MEFASALGDSVIGSSFFGGLGFSGFICVSGDGNKTNFTSRAFSFSDNNKTKSLLLIVVFFEKKRERHHIWKSR